MLHNKSKADASSEVMGTTHQSTYEILKRNIGQLKNTIVDILIDTFA